MTTTTSSSGRVILGARESERLRLLHGSMIVSPAGAGETGWPAWRRQEQVAMTTGASLDVPPEFMMDFATSWPDVPS